MMIDQTDLIATMREMLDEKDAKIETLRSEVERLKGHYVNPRIEIKRLLSPSSKWCWIAVTRCGQAWNVSNSFQSFEDVVADVMANGEAQLKVADVEL